MFVTLRKMLIISPLKIWIYHWGGDFTAHTNAKVLTLYNAHHVAHGA